MTASRTTNYSRPLRSSEHPPSWPEWRPAPLDFDFADTITINADGLRITAVVPRKTSTENFVGHLDAFLAETDGAFRARRRRQHSETTEDGMMDLDQFMDKVMLVGAGPSPVYDECFPTVHRNDTKFALPAAQPRVSFAPSTTFAPSPLLPSPVYTSFATASTTSLTPSSSIFSTTPLRVRRNFGALATKLFFKRTNRATTPGVAAAAAAVPTSSVDLDLQLGPLGPSAFSAPRRSTPQLDITDWLGGLASLSPSMLASPRLLEREDAEEDLYMSDSDDPAPVPDLVRFLNARTEVWDNSRSTIVVGEQGHEVEFEMVGDAAV